MQIDKFKISGDGIFIAWSDKSENQTIDHTLNGHGQARPELYQLMTLLADHVVEICEFPDKYGEGLEVKGVSFSYNETEKGETINGAVLTATKKLESGKTLLINTPHMTEIPIGNSTDFKTCLSSDCAEILERLKKEISEYIGGTRAQLQIFDQKQIANQAKRSRASRN